MQAYYAYQNGILECDKTSRPLNIAATICHIPRLVVSSYNPKRIVMLLAKLSLSVAIKLKREIKQMALVTKTSSIKKMLNSMFFRVLAGCVALFLSSQSWADDDKEKSRQKRFILKADRVFDGHELQTDYAIFVANGKVVEIGPSDQLRKQGAKELNLGDATILPGFIDLHAHLALQNVSHHAVLRHGVTTVRDVGGPLLPPSGGNGNLRVLTTGPIITVPGGYPIPVFGQHGDESGHGHGDAAAVVETTDQAREVVRHLIHGGAVNIKIALEPGGEPGAPWTTGHAPSALPPWPMLTLEMVQTIVDEAHKLGKKVAAHVGEQQGVELALAAGVDEWAHIPCMEISGDLLQQAVQQGVRIVTTIDTLSHCPGVHANTARLALLGANFHYGAEIAHAEIPWGIDARELQLISHLTGMTPLELFKTATSKAGEALDLAPLGTLVAGAPADIIAVKGNAFENFKLLEYPDLVMSGGQLIINHFPVKDQKTIDD